MSDTGTAIQTSDARWYVIHAYSGHEEKVKNNLLKRVESMDMHDKIFELYFTTKKDGSGVGLALTYQILQWHYGTVDFESTGGAGTTFRFHIPAADPHAEPSRELAGNSAMARRAI